MQISIANDLTKIQGIQQTYVASAVSAGGTVSPTKNIAGFTNQWAVQFGQTGEETAEILNIANVPSGTTLTFGTSPSHTGGTFLFGHAQDTPMYQVHYDQVIVNRSVLGTSGPFSPLATVSITPDSQYTTYNDAAGAATYAYYVQYYNSITTDTSGSSSIFIPGGPTFYSFQKLKQRVKDKLYSAGYIRDDTIIGDWLNEWYEQMNNAAIKVNQNYAQGTAVIAITNGTAGLGTITQTDFKNITKLETSYDNGTTFTPSTEIANRSFGDLDVFSALSPQHAWTGETTFRILPSPGNTTSCKARISYSQRFAPFVNDSDEPIQVLKAYTTSATEYCLGVAYGLDQKDQESAQHYSLYDKGKADFIAEITPRDMTGPKNIDLVEGLSGMNEDIAMSAEMII